MSNAASRQLADVISRLRAAGCVFAEEEAALLMEAASEAGFGAGGAAPIEGEPRSPAGAGDRLEAMLARRVAGEPLEQVLGWAEFLGIRVAVRPGVFVPRRRSELLATEAIARTRPGMVVLDLCCGSGALAAAIGAAVPGLTLLAADLDPRAVSCAAVNLDPLGGRALQGDLYGAVPPELRGTVDVLVVNAPYVPSDSIELMPPEARLHEPRSALDGGTDGLDVHRRVARDAPEWLSSRGVLLIETSRAQAEDTAAALRQAGLRTTELRDDDLAATAILAERPS